MSPRCQCRRNRPEVRGQRCRVAGSRQVLVEVRRRQGTGDQIALADVGAKVPERLQDGLVLNALGYDGEAKCSGELAEAQLQNSSAVYGSNVRSQNSVALPLLRCHT